MLIRTTRNGLILALLAVSLPALAFERDVHFGLTKWLAIQAGFAVPEADAIATGNQRVDSGGMQFMESAPIYACLKKDLESATDVARHHHPHGGSLPAAPGQRAVEAASPAAQSAANRAVRDSVKQAPALLIHFGEALHSLQDSWSHQGVGEPPRQLVANLACDTSLMWTHPASRGGANSHRPDLTRDWPADTLAMAKATYDTLQQYPQILGVKRSPKAWSELVPAVKDFARASSKSQKHDWFVAHGIPDTAFLEGISLPDGKKVFDARWTGHKLPQLASLVSTQHKVEPSLLDFFNRFFTQWVTTRDFNALATDFGGRAGAPSSSVPTGINKADLIARLTAWRLRDHGQSVSLIHASEPLSAEQRKAIAAVAQSEQGLIQPAAATEALFPMMVKTPEPVPISGFLIFLLSGTDAAPEKAVAVTKFRHAPYDTVLVSAARVDGRWGIVSIDSIVEH